MRILYVSQYFPPEMGAPAARVHELSREWVAQGHDVTVLTAFPHHPTGVLRDEDRGVVTRRETLDGIDVIRTWVFATPNKGTVKRMLSYASFMGSAAVIGGMRCPRPDIVVATSPQLLCAVAGRFLASRFGVPFVFEVRDLWPESIIAVDAMGENTVVRALKRVADYLYRNCARIVTVGQGYADEIHRLYGIDPGHMAIVPNGIDTRLFEPGPPDAALREEFGWGDRTVLMYLGTHGMAHALHTVLKAARQLQHRSDLLFAFVGEGAEKDGLKATAADWQLSNVQFIDQQPKARVPDFYRSCDIGLVTLRDTPLFQAVLPSKIFEYLGMERPVLISVGGQARAVVEDAGAGRYVQPENADALVAAIDAMLAARDRLSDMGRAGRRYVLAHYDRRVQAGRYLELLADVAAGTH